MKTSEARETVTQPIPQEPALRHRCPLCGSEKVSLSARLSRAEIQASWNVLGITFSSAALESFSPGYAELLKCGACGFEFFDVSEGGNGAFYSQVQAQSANYYVEQRPEFGWTLERCTPVVGAGVLDIGCGDGAFLDLARTNGYRTHGIELNPTAAASSQEKGHQIFSVELAQLAAGPRKGSFELVTAFQVLEHVPEPLEFFEQASKLVRAGGYLAIGVPHAAGIFRICPLDPHQWPPHHLTRWRRKDLARLGQACGLNLADLATDALKGWDLQHFWILQNRLAHALGKRPWPGGERLARIISFVYRKAGCRYFFPRWGPNLFGLFRKDPG